MSDSDKSLGLDGFPRGFFKKCCNFVKYDEVKFTQEFYEHGRLSIDVMVGCLSCLISKFLASRFKFVIGKLVSTSQTTFIEGRKMLNGVLVLNKVLEFVKRMKMSCLVVKVDLEKVYDCVSHSFLRYVLNSMVFGQKWLSGMELRFFLDMCLYW